MKTSTQSGTLFLIIINLALLGLVLARGNPPQPDPAVVPILRVRVLELVDDKGRVRAELKVLPAQPDFKTSEGATGYPEAVQLRLLTSQNGPNVKLVTTEDGAGLVIGGEKGYIQLVSREKEPAINLVTKDGRTKSLTP